MSNHNKSEEFEIISITYTKDPYTNDWSYEMRGIIDDVNLTNEDLILIKKTKIQDLKDEIDQCLAEIDRLNGIVSEMKTLNDNQAKLILTDKLLPVYESFKKKKMYDKIYN